eukprot:433570_1
MQNWNGNHTMTSTITHKICNTMFVHIQLATEKINYCEAFWNADSILITLQMDSTMVSALNSFKAISYNIRIDGHISGNISIIFLYIYLMNLSLFCCNCERLCISVNG